MKKILLTGLIFCLVGAGLIAASISANGYTFPSFMNDASDAVSATFVAERGVKHIVINGSSALISLQHGSVSNVTVDYTESPTTRHSFSQTDDTLYITQEADNSFFNPLKFFSSIPLNITITLPLDAVDAIDVNLTSGNILLDTLHCETVNIQTTSGNTTIRDCLVEGATTIRSTSGSVRLENSDLVGNLSTTMTSGSLYLDRLMLQGNTKLKATSGSIRGDIKGKKDDFIITASVSSGSSNLDNTSSGDKQLDVEVTSGSIRIDFEN